MQEAHKKIPMRDKTHMEQVERWARYVKEHPTEWKKEHTEFVDSVYLKAWDSIEQLSRELSGKEKVEKLLMLRKR